MTTTQQVDTEWFRTPVPLRRNRLHHFAGRVHEVLDEIGEIPTWAMTAHERGETLAELVALQARTQARILALVADADRADDASGAGATNTAAYLRSATGITGAQASRLVRTARAIEPHQTTFAALAEGVIHPEQAAVIAAAVDALPDEVADQRAAAAEHLLGLALEHDAQALRALGRHLLEVIAPDQADALLANKLAREEAQARKTTHVKTWSDGHGCRHIRAKVPDLHGDILDAILQAYANPDRPNPIPRDGAASPQVYGQALCEMLEHYPLDKLPQAGGVTATVVVTMTLDTLMGGLQAAGVLGTDTLLSPGEARRLAAAAGVIPAVLGGQSQLLDLGRRRSFTQAQRIAMAIRLGGLCNIVGCQRPASWCDANHRKAYSHGGRTTLDNGELVCPRHHALVHHGLSYPRRT
jgi:hypothetical protein